MIDLRNHYGFTRTPFGKDLAPGMLHHYPAHAEAVARITWCARERALGVITGEVGSGKTVSARAAIAGLDQTRHTLIYLADPTTGTRGIHHQVVTALGGRPAHGSATLAAQATGLIAAEHGERGRVPLLVIDEAHLLGHDQLEAVRILTNSEMDAASPLACLLIGQPTLRRMLRLGVLAALDQRIALRYAMPAMTAEQTAGYITHHLKLAGRSDPLFSDDAAALIHDAARGLPRAVNNIATQALVAAWAGRKNIIDELDHPEFGGDSILPRCSRLGDCCLPRYRRMAEPRSDHFSAFVLSNICPAALSSCPAWWRAPPARPPSGGVGISSSGTLALRCGFPGQVQGDAQRHRLRRRRRP